jgi:hypothetical protein
VNDTATAQTEAPMQQSVPTAEPVANAPASDAAPVRAERPAQADAASQQSVPSSEPTAQAPVNDNSSVAQQTTPDVGASPEFNIAFSGSGDRFAVDIPDYMMSDIYSGEYPDTLEIPGQGEFQYQGSLGEKDNPFGHVWKNDMGDTYVSKSFGSSLRPFHGDLSEMDFNKR